MKILNSVLIACAWWVAQVSAVVGMDIHQNGLKSVVETIWNGVK
ncbi:putative periplasmic protein [Escherichia phage T4]|nr:putative periplasmic protein [Escherichia phage T4]